MEHGSQQTQHLLFCMEGSSRNSFSLSALINTLLILLVVSFMVFVCIV